MVQVRNSELLFQSETLSYKFKEKLNHRYGPGTNLKFRNYEKIQIKIAKEQSHVNFLRRARDNNVTPKGLRLKTPLSGKRASKIIEEANKKIIIERINYHRWRKTVLIKKAKSIYIDLTSRVDIEDHKPIFQRISVKYKKTLEQQEQQHNKKMETLTREKPPRTDSSSGSNKNKKETVINLSGRSLTIQEKSVLDRGLNFAITPKEVPTIDIIAAVETAALKLDQEKAEEFRWNVRTVLDKQKKPKTNLTKDESNAIKSLKKDNTIKILPADKGNAIVILNTAQYDKKIEEVLEKGSYSILKKDPTTSVEMKIYRLLRKQNQFLDEKTRSRLTPHNSKPPHLYGLPKIHKKDIPLRAIISSRGSPCYNLAKFLLPIITPLTGKSNSFVKDSRHFINIVTAVQLEPEDRLISFDVESLFTNVPVAESLNIVRKKLSEDPELPNRTNLPTKSIMELLECCLTTTYFQTNNGFYQQTDGLPMGSPLSPVMANIFMEQFEETAINTASTKPKMWIRYVDDTFIIWNQSNEELEKFFQHINSISNNINFTMEKEENNTLPFLDVMVERTNGTITTKVYRKPTHTGRYLNYSSNHAELTKIGVAKSLLDRAKTHCSTEQGYNTEINEITNTLKQNGYADKTIKKLIAKNRSKITKQKEKEEERTELYIPYIKGLSDKIKRIGNKFNLSTRFQTTTTLKNILSRTKPAESTETKAGIYQVKCECGKSYIGETKRPLDTRIKEHKRHTERGETEKSGLAEHAWEHHHHIKWDAAKIIMKEQHWYKRKFKEAAIILKNKTEVFSHPSVEIRPIWKKHIKDNPTLQIQDLAQPQNTPNQSRNTSADTPDQSSIPNTLDQTHKTTTLDCTTVPDHPYNTRYKARSLRN